ncbi:MAG TPA: sulfotransferase [Armatimonadetes bacterium]|nr:sulfotransferase [Armatimonadota bacterium]
MADLVWLASFPKAGNTWLRILLANYLDNGDEPADINALRATPIASSRLWFDEWAGVESAQLDAETIANLRPQVYRCVARAAEERRYLKVHDQWGLTPAGEPMFPADVTAGVVYIVRNPLDQVASLANHGGNSLEAAARAICGEASPAPVVRQYPDQLDQRLGGWLGHATSWVEQSGLPVHLVRYEDLRADTAGEFGAALRFLGEEPEPEPERVARAVAFSSFKELRRQEEEHGFHERLAQSSGPFFRQGRSGGWREELSAELVAKVVDACGPLMQRLGYLDEDGTPR